MAQRIKEQIGTIPAIETELHFVQVGREMLRAKAMPRSDDAALKQRECGFHGVRVNVSPKPDILFPSVVDRLMFGITNRLAIGGKVVSHDYVNVLRNVFLNVPCQSSGLGIFGVEESHVTAALTDADNDLLRVPLAAPALTVTAQLSADIGFVHFDLTVEHWNVKFHHGATYAMAEVPCGLIADAESALHLVRRKSLARFTDKQRSYKPFEQRKVRVMEDSASGNAELVVTLFAVQEFPGKTGEFASIATGALRAERPTKSFEEFTAAIIGVECSSYIEECHSECPQ